ncbi:Polynucleotidyl transferase- ribonuclease H-like superfamily protein [Striga hermonthica]|uniref:Polynucleotidyl transferase- ribonuclease H-like superfamily protein n=1 Tax=Striga hermonthica TaxID=68872 RepID=A0A9N7NPR8_STRHE|nr:Polynucleotidyl transferase- ribonuclease H-like superfamily protein [Striga hermonthica]
MSDDFKFPQDSVCLQEVARIWRHVKRGCLWSLGNGLTCRFWLDTRVGIQQLLLTAATGFISPDVLAKPVAAFVDPRGGWNWSSFAGLLPSSIVLRIAATMPPQANAGSDRLILGLTSHGNFSTKSAYSLLTDGASSAARPLWKLIWRLPIAQRVRHFTWLVARDRLLTNVERRRRHLAESAECACCGEEESTLHVLRDCDAARVIWNQLVPAAVLGSFFAMDLSDWLWYNLTPVEAFPDPAWPITFSYACWRMWAWRNAAIFSNITWRVDVKVRDIRCRSEGILRRMRDWRSLDP